MLAYHKILNTVPCETTIFAHDFVGQESEESSAWHFSLLHVVSAVWLEDPLLRWLTLHPSHGTVLYPGFSLPFPLSSPTLSMLFHTSGLPAWLSLLKTGSSQNSHTSYMMASFKGKHPKSKSSTRPRQPLQSFLLTYSLGSHWSPAVYEASPE